MTIGFRPLTRADLPDVLRWHQAAHAAPWFDHEPQDLAGTEHEYGPAIEGAEPTAMHAILLNGRAIGYMQHYLLSSYPDYQLALGIYDDAAGIDYIIGDEAFVGRGFGPQIIRQYVQEIVLPAYPGISSVISSPSPENARSLRALEKAGFRQERTVDVLGQSERLCVFDSA